ncbi:MAG TPA: flagellar basal body P-ring protein FlgI [Candidatus Kryptobacter bacterium]|nr:MAG: flagellar biosynthesis protein FlgA [Ignavibacteriae bacterium 37-53-5]HQT91910.1 flagellar basal body P-ring protein FlgI [Candidatus Kryptobacter bacterium]
MMKKILIVLMVITSAAHATRIKDIAYVKGVNDYQVIGYGLVVGLNGTGDSQMSIFTQQSVASMLKRFGITVNQSQIRMRNVAAVMVVASIPPFSSKGASIDVTVSSMGDATSLQGGALLLTDLIGQDGKIYATAQGPLSVGGFDIRAAGTEIQRNFTTTGRIPNGGLVQETPPVDFMSNWTLSIILSQEDFTTATRVAETINKSVGDTVANAIDGGTINVQVPQPFQSKDKLVQFISQIELLQVVPDVVARVVINERTGTVVVGQNVTVLPVAISHGNLNIEIQAYPVISQPAPFSQGQTVVTQAATAQVTQDDNSMVAINGAATVQDIATALNSLKVRPRDIIAIFQALKAAGALKAELVIM